MIEKISMKIFLVLSVFTTTTTTTTQMKEKRKQQTGGWMEKMSFGLYKTSADDREPVFLRSIGPNNSGYAELAVSSRAMWT